MILFLFFIFFSFEEKNPAILYLKSQIALEKEEYQKSIEYLEKALKENPSPFLKLELAKVLIYEEKFEKALEIIKNLSPSERLNQDYYSLKFFLNLTLDNIEDALNDYEKIKDQKLTKENIVFIMEAIQKNIFKYLSEKSPENSIKLLKIYSQHSPENPQVKEALLSLYMETENFEEIKNILKDMEINDNTFPIILDFLSFLFQKENCDSILNLSSNLENSNYEDILSILSYCFFKTGKIEKTKSTIEKILTLNPNNNKALNILIEIKIIEGEYKDAEELIEKLPKETEEQVNFIREVEALLFQMNGEYNKSEEIYLKLLSKFESKEKIKILKKIYYFYKGIKNCFKTLDYAYKILDEDPADPLSYYRIGEAYLILKDIKNALFFLNLYKDNTEKEGIVDIIWLLLEYDYINEVYDFIKNWEKDVNELTQKNQIYGFYYFKKGDLQKMEEVLKKDRENASSLNLLGYFLIEKDQKIEEAINYIEDALKLEPYNGSYLDSLGWGYFKKGEWEKAYDYLKKANFLEPYNGTILSHLGDVCVKLEKYDEALLRYKQALSFQVPDMSDVLKKIEELIKFIHKKNSPFK